MLHYDCSEKCTGISNVEEGKTRYVVETKSRDSETKFVARLRGWFGKKEAVI